jgi:hypothetical protein
MIFSHAEAFSKGCSLINRLWNGIFSFYICVIYLLHLGLW